MKDMDIKTKIIIGVVALIIVSTIIAYFVKINNTEEDYEMLELTEENEIENDDDYVKNEIMVHVVGEVKYNGIVMLKENSRVVDAIAAAGGETEKADLSKINLAYTLSDGEKLYIPSKEDEETEFITTGNGEKSVQSENGLININSATVTELQNLPGIGEALAERIVMYRTQNGKFSNIEDIKNVSGIGDSKFENIKDLIKV